MACKVVNEELETLYLKVHVMAYIEDNPVEAEINHFFKHLTECLELRRKELIEKYRSIRREPANVSQREKEGKALIEQNELRLETTDVETEQEHHKETINTIKADLDRRRSGSGATRLAFKGDSHELEQLIHGVGELVEEQMLSVPHYRNLRPLGVAKEGREPGELYHPLGVAIDPNTNSIYITEGAHNFSRVSIFSETGEFLDSFSHEHIKKPWGIAINSDNLYVTDTLEHFVFHFKVSVDTRLVGKVGGRGAGSGQFNDPRQLAVSTANGEVFISDCGNHRVQVLDSDLQYKRQISHASLKQPRDVKLTSDEVFVLSSDTSCVHVFSLGGERKHSLVTCGQGMQVTNPYFFCLDANRNIIISDWDTNQVKVFTKKGELLHVLGEDQQQQEQQQGQQEEETANSTRGVALTNNLKLVVVSDNKNNSLQIFSSV